jgi:2-dehydropantoate 2-reductase
VARIAVVGVGGIGAVFGALLHSGGHEVLFCSRRPFARLQIESDDVPMDADVKAMTDPRGVPPDWPSAEWVFVAVKAHQTRSIGPWLARLAGRGTRVVALQNGLGSRADLVAVGCRAEVVETVVYCGARSLEPGRVLHSGGLQLAVAENEAGRDLQRLFAATAATIVLTPDFVTAQWRKLMVNCAANGITALARRPLGVFARADAVEVARDLLIEANSIARAYGAALTETDLDGILDDLGAPGAANVQPSMLQDRLVDRPTEHDALYGAVVRAATHQGLSAPLHRLMRQLIACGDP